MCNKNKYLLILILSIGIACDENDNNDEKNGLDPKNELNEEKETEEENAENIEESEESEESEEDSGNENTKIKPQVKISLKTNSCSDELKKQLSKENNPYDLTSNAVGINLKKKNIISISPSNKDLAYNMPMTYDLHVEDYNNNILETIADPNNEIGELLASVSCDDIYIHSEINPEKEITPACDCAGIKFDGSTLELDLIKKSKLTYSLQESPQACQKPFSFKKDDENSFVMNRKFQSRMENGIIFIEIGVISIKRKKYR